MPPGLAGRSHRPERFLLPPQMIRMSTGHMEGTLQLLYVLLTDCYVYLLRKGACRPLPNPPTPCPSAAWHVVMKVLPAAPRHESGPPLHRTPVISLIPVRSPGEGPGLRWAGGGREAAVGSKHGHFLSGATEKPYLVEEAVSYNELDYVSVSPGFAAAACCRPGFCPWCWA